MKNEKRNPIGGVIIYPPGGGMLPPFIPQPQSPYIPWPKPPKPPIPPQHEEEKLKVKIKSVYAQEFVIVGDYGYLYATGQQANKRGIFKLIIDGNYAKIKQAEGDFIRVDEKDFLVADTNKKGATVFELYKVNKNEYVLRAPNGYFVRVRDKDLRLVAKAEKAGEKTRFKFKTV